MTDVGEAKKLLADIEGSVQPTYKREGVIELLKKAIELAEEVEELEFQLSWWEANYGNDTIKAPTREMNDKFIKAVDDLDNEK